MTWGRRVINEIDSAELQERVAAGEAILLLDIRTEGEVAQGVIPGAQHLPMHLIPLRMSEFPKDKEIVLYCRSGARSYHACAYLAQQGYTNVVNLRGGIIGWARGGYEIAQRLAV
jgi:rhodanese-related sulfurtransferase